MSIELGSHSKRYLRCRKPSKVWVGVAAVLSMVLSGCLSIFSILSWVLRTHSIVISEVYSFIALQSGKQLAQTAWKRYRGAGIIALHSTLQAFFLLVCPSSFLGYHRPCEEYDAACKVYWLHKEIAALNLNCMPVPCSGRSSRRRWVKYCWSASRKEHFCLSIRPQTATSMKTIWRHSASARW